MTERNQPLVSIIVRARNEEVALVKLLSLLARQEADFEFEVWVLDNESTDNTAQIARSYGAKVYTIPRDDFNYSTALNLGAELAEGAILVHLSAHCFPQSEHWLAYLVDPIRRRNEVIATYGRQWVDPDQNPYEAEGNDIFFPSNRDQLQIVAFSNANAAIRKEVVQQHPFNPYVKILEDHLFYLELSSTALFEYVPEALVHHEHDEFSLRYYLKRWQLEGWAFYFILKHRGFASPFKAHRFFQADALRGYRWLGRKLYKQGRRKAGIVALPFFLLREIVWLRGWLTARLSHRKTAQQDRDFLYDLVSRSNKQTSQSSHSSQPAFVLNQTDQDISQWPEEWQLKADWPYIRENVAEFIRRCYEEDGIFQNPVLEIGASGQNDYIGEKYELMTSNLAYNPQGTQIDLDMEDMSRFADSSVGSILCSEVIEHVKHPNKAFTEAYRVLKPGGKLIITTPYAIIIHNTPEDGGFHGRNFTPQGLELGLTEAGFKIHTLETRGPTLTRQRLLPSNICAIAEK